MSNAKSNLRVDPTVMSPCFRLDIIPRNLSSFIPGRETIIPDTFGKMLSTFLTSNTVSPNSMRTNRIPPRTNPNDAGAFEMNSSVNARAIKRITKPTNRSITAPGDDPDIDMEVSIDKVTILRTTKGIGAKNLTE